MKRKVPFIGQVQESECGICCTSMLLHYYHVELGPRELEKNISIGRDGVDFNDIKKLFTSLNFDTSFYECSTEQLPLLGNLPLILFWNNNHFVVLEKIRQNMYFIIDPNLGRIKLDKEAFDEQFSSVVLKAVPTEETKPVKSNEKSWQLYTDFMKENRMLLISVFVFALISYMIIMYIPQTMQGIIDSKEAIRDYFQPMLALLMSFVGITFIRNYLVVKISSGLDTYTYTKIVEKIFSVNYSYFLTRNSSDLLYRITLNRANRDVFVEILLNGIIDAGMLIYISLALLKINSLLFLLNTGIFIIMAAILGSLRHQILLKNKEEIMVNTKMQGLEYEALSAIFTVKGSGQEQFTKKNILLQHQESLEKFKKRNYINSTFSITSNFFKYFAALILFLVSFVYQADLGISLGQIVAINTLVTFFYASSQNVFVAVNSLGTIKNNLLRIQDIIEQPDETEDIMKKVKINTVNKIAFEQVSFAYPGQTTETIKNVSFSISKGEKIAFVGETGSGKSTIIGLLLGLYDTYQGRLSINDIDAKDIDMYHHREHLGFVPQEPFIFNKSIKENIYMGRPIEEKEMISACKAAQIHEDIEKMPMKYETIISESGHNISGGQKQRLIIARAIARNPDLVLLDEATSDIDNQTERKISDYFKHAETTQVIVAHRLSTIVNADKIIVLQNGRILAIDSHQNLFRTCDYYRHLYEKEDHPELSADQFVG